MLPFRQLERGVSLVQSIPQVLLPFTVTACFVQILNTVGERHPLARLFLFNMLGFFFLVRFVPSSKGNTSLKLLSAYPSQSSGAVIYWLGNTGQELCAWGVLVISNSWVHRLEGRDLGGEDMSALLGLRLTFLTLRIYNPFDGKVAMSQAHRHTSTAGQDKGERHLNDILKTYQFTVKYNLYISWVVQTAVLYYTL